MQPPDKALVPRCVPSTTSNIRTTRFRTCPERVRSAVRMAGGCPEVSGECCGKFNVHDDKRVTRSVCHRARGAAAPPGSHGPGLHPQTFASKMSSRRSSECRPDVVPVVQAVVWKKSCWRTSPHKSELSAPRRFRLHAPSPKGRTCHTPSTPRTAPRLRAAREHYRRDTRLRTQEASLCPTRTRARVLVAPLSRPTHCHVEAVARRRRWRDTAER